MDNTGLFIVIFVVAVLVVGLIVALLWPKSDPNSGSATPNTPPSTIPNTSNSSGLDLTDTTQPVGASYSSFEKAFSELGAKQFDLIESIGTEHQGAVRAEVSSLIQHIAAMICDEHKAKAFIESYNAKIDNLVRYVAITVENDLNKSSFSGSGSDEHTLTGTHTGTSSNCQDTRVQGELAKIKIQLNLLSAALAEAFGLCLSVDGKDLVSLLNVMDAALISYNNLYNIQDKAEEAKIFRKRHLRLWKKVHLSS